MNTSEDGNIENILEVVEPIKKKRGRKSKINKQKKKPGKRGRKRKDTENIIKPEHVLDYICQNYPQLGVGKVRESILVALKTHHGQDNPHYVLDCLQYKATRYYYDHYGNVLNKQAEMVGTYIKNEYMNKIIMFNELDDELDLMTSGGIIRLIKTDINLKNNIL